MLVKRSLVRHPASSGGEGLGVGVTVKREGEWLTLDYEVSGDTGGIRWPAPAAPTRTDGLWQSTCFELFVKGDGEVYAEYNFAPTGQWAAYSFERYREGMRPIDMATAPEIETEALGMRAKLRVDALSGKNRIGSAGVSAVIEMADGAKSYWALVHPEGKPDFHHPACFALQLAAPDAA